MNNENKNEGAPMPTPVGSVSKPVSESLVREETVGEQPKVSEETAFAEAAEEMFAKAAEPCEPVPESKQPCISITMEEQLSAVITPSDITEEKKREQPKADVNPAETAQESPVTHISDREVMAHTASIWQYREIVNDGTEQHTELHSKRLETPFAEVIGARARGKKHKHEGTNCDDFFETAVTDDCVISVVCDGAGSKPLSRIGSRVCSETAAKFLKEKLAELFVMAPELKPSLAGDMSAPEFMDGCMKIAKLVQESARKSFAALNDKLAEIAADEVYRSALGRAPVYGDLSTTFLAAVIVPLIVDGKRQSFMATVQIGDGCICAIDSTADAEHCFKLMGAADSGKFSGETDFISEKNTTPDALAGRTRVSRGCSDIFMLMSDGVADDYFPAQPMMKRLYLDLCLNGVLPMKGELVAGEDPAPIFYASVSQSRKSVALQYAKQLLSEGTEEEMNGLWDKREMLRCHSLEAFRMNIGDMPEERLCVWLDNYNERGSFDDRTLTVIRLK